MQLDDCPTALVEPLLESERAWGGDSHLAKHSINCMIGLWASTRTHYCSVITSSNPSDCPQSVLARRFPHGDGSVIDHIQVTQLLDNGTMRPLHDLIMHTEAARMAQFSYIVTRRGCPQVRQTCLKRDALILDITTKTFSAVKAVSTLRFDELHTLRRTYELQSEATQSFLSTHVEMTPLTSSDVVFRFS